MEQTSIQKALSILDEQEKYSCFEIPTETMRIHLQELLAYEKQQIIDAFNNGIKTRYTQGAVMLGLSTLPKKINTGEDYYNDNFDNSVAS